MKLLIVILIITLIVIVIEEFLVKDEKTKLNLFTFSKEIKIIVGVQLIGILIYCICQELPTNDNTRNIVTTFMSGIFLISEVLILKNIILDIVRTADYYIHRKTIFNNGQVAKGTVIGVEEDGVGRGWTGRGIRKYRLIVDFNGKKLKSIWFLDKSYSKRKTIDVITYKSRSYVALKSELKKFKVDY